MADVSLLPAYLIVGADEYKRSKALARMKARLDATGMAEFNLDERDLSHEAPMDDVIASLNTFPMGSDFRLVILHGCDRLPKAVSESLVGYLANPSPTTVCLIEATSLAKNTRLYKAVAALGSSAVVDCAPKKAWEMPKQVVSMAKSHNKTINLDAATELVSRVGESSRMLDNELARLASMLSGTQITRADVERLVVRTAEPKPWDLLDALSARDMGRTLELLALQPQGSEIRIFSLAVGRIRELLCARALDARGEGKNLAQTLGMQSWQVKNHLSWARRYTTEELIDALRYAADTESQIKSSGDSALALRLWMTRILSKDE